MNLLELNHVEKSFENLSVLKDISISIGEANRIHHRTIRIRKILASLCDDVRKMDGGEIVYLGKKRRMDRQGRTCRLCGQKGNEGDPEPVWPRIPEL